MLHLQHYFPLIWLDLLPLPSGGPPLRTRRLRIMPWQGLLHACSVLVAVGLARFAVFDIVQFVSSSRPTEGMLLGSLLLTTGAGMTPLVWKCYPGSQVSRLKGASRTRGRFPLHVSKHLSNCSHLIPG